MHHYTGIFIASCCITPAFLLLIAALYLHFCQLLNYTGIFIFNCCITPASLLLIAALHRHLHCQLLHFSAILLLPIGTSFCHLLNCCITRASLLLIAALYWHLYCQLLHYTGIFITNCSIFPQFHYYPLGLFSAIC